jgi:formylglycine-generating enzyme required for sulfatase activity
MFRKTALGILIASTALSAIAQDHRFTINGQQIFAPSCLEMSSVWEGPQTPCTPYTMAQSFRMHQRWLSDLQHWREETRIRITYSDARYRNPALQWTQSSFMQSQMMIQDRYFYDPANGRYTVGRYLDDLEQRYGGIDAVLIWPTYPNLGVDDRNQLQMIESMPGGEEGVRKVVADFHRHGVRVLFPMMLWDEGTQAPGEDWPTAMVKLMKQLDVDGMNGDTMHGIPLGFVEASDKLAHPMVFEPEITPSEEALAWNLMTWGQYEFPFAPAVDRFKWLETRHMVNISDRWARDKNNDLQFAFFNGVGWESWENIWGIWNGITPRDAEATRRVSAIERAFAPFLSSPDWEPLYPMHGYGVYSSRWPKRDETLWTIVNRNEYEVTGQQISFSETISHNAKMRYFDLYHGVELTPSGDSDHKTLSFSIEGNGFGAILVTTSEPDQQLLAFLGRMQGMTAKPLSNFQHEWKPLRQQMTAIPLTEPAKKVPAGMVLIPGGDFLFKVQGTEIEGSAWAGVDVQYPWEESPRRYHERKLHLKRFYIDKYPVTNAEFKQFLNATHYVPADAENFLKDWKDGEFPKGWENRPVTWVSLEDARVYAGWAGKRLPHEWEWQRAAQGTDGRTYPWGDQWQEDAVPTPDTGRKMRGPDPVDAHPEGASPDGVMDMVGNVWQWTEEFSDDHTRAAIVRGGEYYKPQGSMWYFPQAYHNYEHSKLLLMAPSYDRSGGVGFRCVQDAE